MNEELLQKIAELTSAVKENGGLNGLQKDALLADFKNILEEQQRQAAENAPVRPGEFQSDPVQRAADAVSGRYAGMVRSIARHGEFKSGGWRVSGADLLLAKTLIDRANALKSANVPFSGSDKVRPASEDLVAAVKALTSTGTATGDELVPVGMAGQLWDDFFAASRIVADLPSQPMPTDPFDMPLGLGDVTWRKGTQNTATTASDTATAKSTLTSTEQIAEVNWSYNLDEDSIIAMMPALRARLAQSGGEQMDAFALNADATNTSTGNINSDNADPADDSYYLSEGQDGIRHQWLVDASGQGNSAGGDALTDADMVAGLRDLGKYGLDVSNCRIVPDILTYIAMLGLTNVATVDKYGPSATILSGELAKYRGIPIIPSASHPLGEADGKVGASNTLGSMSIYNRNLWRAGFRRGLTIEVDRDIQKRQLIMVVSFRIAVAAHGTRSAATHTAGIYNILV